MSLPNVSFTNNLGTLAFQRCLLGITDSWEFDGRVSRHVKSITVDGHVKRGEPYLGLLTDRGTDGKRYGGIGALTLPWTTLNRIAFQDLSFPEDTWLDFVKVSATFLDEFPDVNSYTLSFFGLTVYNPRLSVPIPMRELRDDYPQMPMKFGGSFTPRDPRVGVFRNRVPRRNMDVSLTGAIRMDDNKFPADLVAKLTRRANMGADLVTTDLTVPTGWPMPFNLGDAIPEVKNDLNLAHVFIVSAQISWRVEDQVAQINVRMLCPPQIYGRQH